MGGFEIILIAIGIGWTVISGVIKSIEESKKKAAAKAGSILSGDAAAPESHPDAQSPDPFDSPMEMPARSGGSDVALSTSKPRRGSKTFKRLDELRKRRIEQLQQRMGIQIASPPKQRPVPTPPPVRAAREKVDPQASPGVDATATGAPATTSRSDERNGARSRILAQTRSGAGLKDAIVLSELLSPPVALRNDHLN